MPTMGANSQRAEKQAKLPIQVIVANPPWSVGQRSAGEDNPNVPHPALEQRIKNTYALRSTASNKRALYDLYKMSIRWATDRIGERGIIAFVTPNGYLYGNAESACAPAYPKVHHYLHFQPPRRRPTIGRSLATGRGKGIRTEQPPWDSDHGDGPQSRPATE